MRNTFRINENLVVDSQFRDFLSANSSRVVMMILSFITLEDINYIGITDKIDTVSYLPSNKFKFVEENDIDPFSDGIGRQSIKVGRLIFKLFPKNLIDEYIHPSHIEEFVNLFKSFFDQSNRRLVVVSGEDIRKYYLDKNYAYPDRGTLWKSCMRYQDRQRFLDLYVVSPDKIKMLVLLVKDELGVEKVKGRALLWEEVEDMSGNKLKFMDRIYTIFDSDVFIFKGWARENGYISKMYQNAKSHDLVDINGEETLMNLSVTLENHKLNYYPYLDTFSFYNCKLGRFSNNENKYYDFILVQSNGGLHPPDPEPEPELEDNWINEEQDDW
jgi:hypothetical protein